MTRISWSLLAFALLTLGSPAFAQTFQDVGEQLNAIDHVARRAVAVPSIRVQISYLLQWPGNKAETIDEQKAFVASSHEAIYDLAAHECEHLKAVSAGPCRLVSINVTNAAQSNGQGTANAVATANATFDILPKAPD